MRDYLYWQLWSLKQTQNEKNENERRNPNM
jgi:hypothetical protein